MTLLVITPWTWAILLGLYIVVGHIWGAWLLKKISREGAREERFVLNYVLAAALAACFAIYLGDFSFGTAFFIVLGMGFANGLAAYCQWRATDISLSKSHLFTWGDDVIAMVLAYYLLNESQFVTQPLGFGIAISLIAAALFLYRDYQRSKESEIERGRSPLSLYLWVAGYSAIWGCTTFLVRYLAVADIGIGIFWLGWYWGALLSATLIILPLKARKRGGIESVTSQDVKAAALFAVVIMAALALHYFTLQLAPIIVVQPILLIVEMLVPVLLGLFIFAEAKHLSKQEWLYFALGLLGACAIIFGFVSGL